MTKHEMRVAIATHLFPQYPVYEENGQLRHRYPDGKSGPAFNYPEDLNAMAMAEDTLDPLHLKYPYAHNLYNVVTPKEIQPFRAKAEHRAEAFLRTVGKWKE